MHLKTQPDTILEALRWRYATKQFDPSAKIPAAAWTALEEALVLTPSSFGLQPWRFIVVENADLREKLVGVSWGQRQAADASHLVVFAVKHPVTEADVDAHIDNTARVQGTDAAVLAPLRKVIVDFIGGMDDASLKSWASRQVYLALGGFMTSAAMLGIDTCPMEGIDPAAYDRLLGLEGSGYFTLAACAAGSRHPDDKYAKRPKVRFDRGRVITRVA